MIFSNFVIRNRKFIINNKFLNIFFNKNILGKISTHGLNTLVYRVKFFKINLNYNYSTF